MVHVALRRRDHPGFRLFGDPETRTAPVRHAQLERFAPIELDAFDPLQGADVPLYRSKLAGIVHECRFPQKSRVLDAGAQRVDRGERGSHLVIDRVDPFGRAGAEVGLEPIQFPVRGNAVEAEGGGQAQHGDQHERTGRPTCKPRPVVSLVSVGGSGHRRQTSRIGGRPNCGTRPARCGQSPSR